MQETQIQSLVRELRSTHANEQLSLRAERKILNDARKILRAVLRLRLKAAKQIHKIFSETQQLENCRLPGRKETLKLCCVVLLLQ